ncbi:hypothetical protein [Desulfitobacterium sp. AusDCA]|uniref:hypothetical protein n=1 Tax=Desulfitobacterium sp. AusDCA TaxID=3240383 RepID=UPI003DA6CE54
MNPISVNFGLFGLAATFNFVLWIVGFACLIQLFRFLTKGIKALDIFITENRSNNKTDNR